MADSDRPGVTASITLADRLLASGESTLVTVRFSAPVTGFALGDLTVSNGGGQLDQFTPGADGLSWSARLTAPIGTSFTGRSISLNANAVADQAGRPLAQSASVSYDIDATPPRLTRITIDNHVLKADAVSTVHLIFNEQVAGLRADHLNVPGGRLTDIQAVNGQTDSAGRIWATEWRARLEPTPDTTSADNIISVRNFGGVGSVTDRAGNTATGSPVSTRYDIDTQRPDIVSIEVANPNQTLGLSTQSAGRLMKIVFSEAVPNLGSGHLHADNVLLTGLNSDDGGITWSATLRPLAGVESNTNRVTLLPGAQDAAGNDVTSQSLARVASNNYRVDTVPPVFAGATVDAAQLQLRYTEANSLDAARGPGKTNFVVHVDNVAAEVSAVAVNAQAKTVTLTLAHAVTAQQEVTVSYTDPSRGNDNNAIQDAAGNDAASITARPVENTTAPPPPDETPSPTTPSGQCLSDLDRDSLPNAMENRATGIPGPGGAAPVTGDGNGDGIQDSVQPAVGSARFAIPAAAGAPQAASTYITLVVGSQDGKLRADPDNTAHILALVQKNAPERLPPGLEMPIGLAHFTTALAAGRNTESFSLYLDPALGVNGNWVQNHDSGVWVNLASEAYGGKMLLEGERLRLDFHITDGGPFDADGKINGSITVADAAAHMPLTIVGQTPDTGDAGFWL